MSQPDQPTLRQILADVISKHLQLAGVNVQIMPEGSFKELDEAEAAICLLVEGAAPPKVKYDSPQMLNNGWFDFEYRAHNAAIDQYTANIKARLGGKRKSL